MQNHKICSMCTLNCVMLFYPANRTRGVLHNKRHIHTYIHIHIHLATLLPFCRASLYLINCDHYPKLWSHYCFTAARYIIFYWWIFETRKRQACLVCLYPLTLATPLTVHLRAVYFLLACILRKYTLYNALI